MTTPKEIYRFVLWSLKHEPGQWYRGPRDSLTLPIDDHRLAVWSDFDGTGISVSGNPLPLWWWQRLRVWWRWSMAIAVRDARVAAAQKAE